MGLTDEETILEEAIDNLMEAAQRIRASENRLRFAGLDEHPIGGNLRRQVSSALAMTKVTFFEARCRSERGQRRNR